MFKIILYLILGAVSEGVSGLCELIHDVPVNVPVNKRQQWFLNQLSAGIQCKPADIVARWGVVSKTAKRDISFLTKNGIVVFVGAPKTGSYHLKSDMFLVTSTALFA